MAGQPSPSGASGGPIVSVTGPGRGSQRSADRISRVPRIAIGTTGRPVSTADLNAPSRKGRIPGDSTNVPSGKTRTELPPRRAAVIRRRRPRSGTSLPAMFSGATRGGLRETGTGDPHGP